MWENVNLFGSKLSQKPYVSFLFLQNYMGSKTSIYNRISHKLVNVQQITLIHIWTLPHPYFIFVLSTLLLQCLVDDVLV